MAARKVTTIKLSKETGFSHTTIIALRKGEDTRVSTFMEGVKDLKSTIIIFF